jgi:hypothetical protein
VLNIFSWFTNELIYSLIVPGIGIGVVLLLIAEFVPDWLKQYRIQAQLLGLIICIFFTFQSGREHEFDNQKLVLAEQKALVEQYKTKSGEVTIEVQTKYVDKIKYVERIKEVPVNVYVTKEADAKCVIDPVTSDGIRLLLDSSIAGQLPKASTGTNEGSTNAETTTGIQLKLSTIVASAKENYATSYQIREQLISLQEWITKQDKLYNSTK